MFEGLRKPIELMALVVILLASGCPVQAIGQAFGLDERTVADGRDRAGKHCQQLHEALVEQGHLDLVQGPGRRDRRQRAHNGCLDGIGHEDFDPALAGRDAEPEPGQGSG